MNGLDYPVTHIKQLGELAQQAFDERKRNRKNAEKLTDLDFLEDEAPKATQEKKSSTKLDMLRKRMKKWQVNVKEMSEQYQSNVYEMCM